MCSILLYCEIQADVSWKGHVRSAEQIMNVLDITFFWYLVMCRSVEIYGGTICDRKYMHLLFDHVIVLCGTVTCWLPVSVVTGF